MPESHAPHISLKRDSKGRIAERTLTLGGMPETRRYAYDPAGRLAQVTDERGGLLESYTYDHQARRLADIRPQSQVGERRFSYGHGNRLAAAGETQYSHDRAGFRNLKVEGAPGLGGAETWYHYEPSGLLLAVDLPGGSRIEYAYDKHGLRREKRLDGRLVAAYDWLDPLRLSEFFDGREWWRLAYTEGRTPVGVTNGRDSFLLLADQLGTPVALATPDGRIVQSMRYDSFGNLLESRGGVVDLPLGFAGGLFDRDTGLTRFVWREYDAETGRFTALDPLREKGGDADFYGYCVDDPVNRVDVWGLEGSWWDGAGGRIVRRDIEGAGTGAIGGAVAGSPTGVGIPLGAIVGGLMGLPTGMLKGTLEEIGRPSNKNDTEGSQPQEDAPSEARKALEEWWRRL